MSYRTGTQLHPDDRKHVLASYVHRFTGTHRPDWTKRPSSAHCPVQFADDNDWLANTQFRVRADGRLDRRANSCVSSPTWPSGKLAA
jgi:hypothetical protein